jgi:hypothetical protein
MSGTSAMGGADPEVMAAIDRGNAVVFFDIALGEGPNAAELGRIKLELFVKDVSHSEFWFCSLHIVPIRSHPSPHYFAVPQNL